MHKDNKSMEVIEKKEVPSAKVRFCIIFTRKFIVQLYENLLQKTHSFLEGCQNEFFAWRIGSLNA